MRCVSDGQIPHVSIRFSRWLLATPSGGLNNMDPCAFLPNCFASFVVGMAGLAAIGNAPVASCVFFRWCVYSTSFISTLCTAGRAFSAVQTASCAGTSVQVLLFAFQYVMALFRVPLFCIGGMRPLFRVVFDEYAYTPCHCFPANQTTWAVF